MDELRSLEDLLDLQGVDLEIDRLLERRQALPELEQYKEAHNETEALAAQVGEAEEQFREVARQFDKSSGELTILEQKRDSEERRLYAGGLNARETEALMQEVEMLRRQAEQMEEATIAVMEQRDEAEAVLEDLRTRLAAAQSNEAELQGMIKKEWAVIDADIARHEARKADIAKLISGDLIEIYEEIRPIKDGVAVGRLGGGVCGGCHLRLSEAEQLEALRQDPPRCTHCRRILVPQ